MKENRWHSRCQVCGKAFVDEHRSGLMPQTHCQRCADESMRRQRERIKRERDNEREWFAHSKHFLGMDTEAAK